MVSSGTAGAPPPYPWQSFGDGRMPKFYGHPAVIMQQHQQREMQHQQSLRMENSMGYPFSQQSYVSNFPRSVSNVSSERTGASYASSVSDATECGPAKIVNEEDDELVGFLDLCFPPALAGERAREMMPQQQQQDQLMIKPASYSADMYKEGNNYVQQQQQQPDVSLPSVPMFTLDSNSNLIHNNSNLNRSEYFYRDSNVLSGGMPPATNWDYNNDNNQNSYYNQTSSQQMGSVRMQPYNSARYSEDTSSMASTPSTPDMASHSDNSSNINLVGTITKKTTRKSSSTSSTGSKEGAQIVYRKLWSEQDDELLSSLVHKYGKGNWKKLAEHVPGKTATQCSQRWRKALDPNIIKGKWSSEEDEKLRRAVATYGPKWRKIASVIPGRTGKQCRDRYTSRLRPEIQKIGNWTAEEDSIILKAHQELGNRWAAIQKLVPDRAWYSIKWRIETLKRSASKEEEA